MSTCIAGHRGLRNGVVHTGAVALMLGAALAMNTAGAAENDVDDSIAQPAPPAPPAPSARPATPAPPAAPRSRQDNDARMRDAEERMRDAQERLNRASAEIAEIAAQRAADAMENIPFFTEGGRRTTIGVDLSPDSKDGARVLDVSPGGAAEEAGIRANDVIVMVNGTEVKADSSPGGGSRQVVQLLRAAPPNSKVKLRVMRDGKPKDLEVTPRPYVFSFQGGGQNIFESNGNGFRIMGPFGGNGDLAGLEVTTLTPQLGRYFGANKGVLVVRAPKSDVYKLQDGDVILSIDGREPTSGSHITRILSSYQPGEQVTLRVMRDRKQQDIQVTVPERGRHSRVPTAWVDLDEVL